MGKQVDQKRHTTLVIVTMIKDVQGAGQDQSHGENWEKRIITDDLEVVMEEWSGAGVEAFQTFEMI